MVPTPRGGDGPRVPGAEHAEKHRQKENRASSRQSSLPSQCSSPGNGNPASVGRGDTPSTAPRAGMEGGVLCETRREGEHTDMPGGWRRTISLLEAREGRSWQHGQGKRQKNDMGDISAGEEWEGETWPRALAAPHTTSLPTSPCRAHPCPISRQLPSQGGPDPGSGGAPAVAAIDFGLSPRQTVYTKGFLGKKKMPKPLSMPSTLEDEQGVNVQL